ncbi:unnamed protein product [Sphagnum balticum]
MGWRTALPANGAFADYAQLRDYWRDSVCALLHCAHRCLQYGYELPQSCHRTFSTSFPRCERHHDVSVLNVRA